MTGPGAGERPTETIPDVFRRMADESFARGGSPLYARLAREYADDPLVAEIAGDHKPRWEVPLRLFGGVHFLALTGEEPEPWGRLREVLRRRRAWLAEFVGAQPVQTNEVQRCWALLPAFLSLADGRPLDLVELGPSAGLNLLWDRWRYRYPAGTWGAPDAPLTLAGEAEGGPPSELLARTVDVRARLGIDRAPVDIADEQAALRLEAFVWADQDERLERLRRAIEVARRDPPRLVQGDYVELLPGILERRERDALTVVFNSATTGYLRADARERLADAIASAGRDGSLAWVSYEFVEAEQHDPTFDAFALEVRVSPDGEPRLLARVDGHGNRLRWLA
jgi:hypothetical protein